MLVVAMMTGMAIEMGNGVLVSAGPLAGVAQLKATSERGYQQRVTERMLLVKEFDLVRPPCLAAGKLYQEMTAHKIAPNVRKCQPRGLFPWTKRDRARSGIRHLSRTCTTSWLPDYRAVAHSIRHSACSACNGDHCAKNAGIISTRLACWEVLSRPLHPHNVMASSVRCATKRAKSLIVHAKESEHPADTASQADFNDMYDANVDWLKLAGILFASGCIAGPLLDGIHSCVDLVVYEKGAVAIGTTTFALKTNFWVSPLLGAFYAVVGTAHVFLEKLAKPGQEQDKVASFSDVALSMGAMSAVLGTSSILYHTNAQFGVIHAVLAPCALLTWRLIDNSWWGLSLASICSLAAIFAELPFIRWFHLWYYPDADLFGKEGIVSWVIWCYFTYTVYLGRVANFTARRISSQNDAKKSNKSSIMK